MRRLLSRGAVSAAALRRIHRRRLVFEEKSSSDNNIAAVIPSSSHLLQNLINSANGDVSESSTEHTFRNTSPSGSTNVESNVGISLRSFRTLLALLESLGSIG